MCALGRNFMIDMYVCDTETLPLSKRELLSARVELFLGYFLVNGNPVLASLAIGVRNVLPYLRTTNLGLIRQNRKFSAFIWLPANVSHKL